MTDHSTAALDTALAYYRAWTSKDFELAMTYIAEGIVCQAPAGRLEGAEAFRAFMGERCAGCGVPHRHRRQDQPPADHL